MALRLIQDPDTDRERAGADPRDPTLYRTGLSSARAALRDGVARRHEREVRELELETARHAPDQVDPARRSDEGHAPGEG